MDLHITARNIVRVLEEKYSEYIEAGSIDITQIINICNVDDGEESVNSIELSDIEFSTPEFSNTNIKKHSTTKKSKEFKRRYAFFVKLLYACLKLRVRIFSISGDTMILKNNHNLIKALDSKKKKLIDEHIQLLQNQRSNISNRLTEKYPGYIERFVTKIKIIEKVIASLESIIEDGIIDRCDNLLKLLLPYFYVYTEYIEEYR